ncbi:MAG: nucleotide sugar dehydrogenase [Alphaproteobacteria bacterium]|nr:MAG: nucleotide sugar dehydrogenase [Alphaproteobacteria bacterium]
MTHSDIANSLQQKIDNRSARVGVIGMGYVGLPLAATIARKGFTVTGFDIDENRISSLNKGVSHIDAVHNDELARLVGGNFFSATSDFAPLADCDVITICVPTPLSKHREPDLSFVEQVVGVIATHLKAGQLIVLESTTYPGTTDEIVCPILEQGGLKSGADFFLGFSPEREDPGNPDYSTETIPKIVAGDGETARDLVTAFYSAFMQHVVPVSTNSVAEAVKITENIFRSVNIALVNELKIIYSAMGIDVWEVIEAAKTKPFGFMPFYPGPGLGGHCIPIDPFYLAWKSREFGLRARFIELAGEINIAMPDYVIRNLEKALDDRQRVSLGSSKILVLGLAYKANVSDIRESPSVRLLEMIEKRGADVDYHDPLVPVIPHTSDHPTVTGKQSVSLDAETIAQYNAVLICTDHQIVDYKLVVDHAQLVVDTRNIITRLDLDADNVVRT